MLPGKRKRDDTASRSTSAKRPRHTALPDLLSPLSDELLVRILSFLPLPDLLSLAPVSKRFYQLAGDSQLWKQLYYTRFVLPRALRIPGFRDGSAREGKLHFSSRRAIWADGRRGGWVDIQSGREDAERRNWKRQFKLRHNWSRGKCAVEELQVGPEPGLWEPDPCPKMLVKVSEGIAVTADLATGLRAWDLKTKQLLVETDLTETDTSCAPSCIAIDEQSLRDRILDIAVGFTDGSFGVWRLDSNACSMVRRHRHEKSSNGELVGIALSTPYLLTATKSVLISLYTFDVPTETEDKEAQRDTGGSRADKGAHRSSNLPAPFLLTSLRSHTSRAPLALSIRKSANSTIASICYTFSTLQGWSLGIQELHLRHTSSNVKKAPDITTTRLAYSPPIRSVRPRRQAVSASSSSSVEAITPSSDRPRHDMVDGPINLCYTHPYLLATLPDNTLILHLCTSTASSLLISPGIRLWGHTSGISDAEITARGKAVSVSTRGEEIRVWELEGRAEGKSIEVRPTVKSEPEAEGSAEVILGSSVVKSVPDDHWDERRNWVGFDDEMVIVLKETRGRESLMVYDFT